MSAWHNSPRHKLECGKSHHEQANHRPVRVLSVADEFIADCDSDPVLILLHRSCSSVLNLREDSGE